MRTFTNLMLGLFLLCIPGVLCAQNDNNYRHLPPEEQLFTLPPFSIQRTYHVNLGKGNKFQLEIGDPADLDRLQNVDSLLMVFLSDIKAFRDSLSDPLTVKRIDYLSESPDRKKLRIRQFRPSASTFLLDGGEPAQLRLRQDTIFIILSSSRDGRPRYDRFGFFLNRYDELESLVTTGLDEKIKLMKDGVSKWSNNFSGRGFVNQSDRSIKEDSWNKDQLEIAAFMNVQNYKNYFVPSVSLGASVHLERTFNIHEFGAYWEPNFFFKNDVQGKPQTYRNDFLVVRYAYDRSDKKNGAVNGFGLTTNISVGYLIHQEGDFFNKHTFRLTAGELKLSKGRILVQPMIYFNDFFRGVTPGLRLSFHAL